MKGLYCRVPLCWALQERGGLVSEKKPMGRAGLKVKVDKKNKTYTPQDCCRDGALNWVGGIRVRAWAGVGVGDLLGRDMPSGGGRLAAVGTGVVGTSDPGAGGIAGSGASTSCTKRALVVV